MGKIIKEHKRHKIGACFGAFICILFMFFAICFTPNFVENNLGPDGFLEQTTIFKINFIRLGFFILSTIGLLISALCINKPNLLYQLQIKISYHISKYKTKYLKTAIVTGVSKALRSRYDIILALGILYIYDYLSQKWMGFKYMDFRITGFFFKLEFPILVAIYLLLRFPRKNKLVTLFGPALFLFTIYVYNDLVYCYLDRLISFTDIANIGSLIDVIGFFKSSLAIVPLLMAFSIILINAVSYYRTLTLNRTIVDLLSRITFVFIAFSILFWGNNHAILFTDKVGTFDDWSQGWNIKKNGRIICVVRNDLIKKINLEHIRGIEVSNPSFYKKSLKVKPKNVHLIILESFIDPRLCKGLVFDRSPVHDKLLKFISGSFEICEAPVYGGGTSQSEFEILSGVPAFSAITSIEFNAFTGRPTYSLPKVLKNQGYTSIVSASTHPNFYNSRLAYEGLQFSELHFEGEKSSYLKKAEGDVWLFDGDLLRQNLDYIKEKIAKKQKLFNYVLGMYGHSPYQRNLKKRPDEITATYKNGKLVTKELHRMINQFYYRTEAIANYLETLGRIDPNSLILVISDHLPVLIGERDKSLQYLPGVKNKFKKNIVIFLIDGKPAKLDCQYYFQIHHKILSVLAEEYNFKFTERDELKKDYYKIMAAALQ